LPQTLGESRFWVSWRVPRLARILRELPRKRKSPERAFEPDFSAPVLTAGPSAMLSSLQLEAAHSARGDLRRPDWQGSSRFPRTHSTAQRLCAPVGRLPPSWPWYTHAPS